MAEYTADAFANRDEPVPLLTVNQSDFEPLTSEGESEGRRQRIKKSLSPGRLKEKASSIAAVQAELQDASPEGRVSLQDRLFSRILQQVIPAEDIDDDDAAVDRRSSKYVKRPAFSLPLMTSNFRRFNARIGIVFVFQNRLIRLFTWRIPTHTLAFLATYSFVCLDPNLIAVLPFAIILLFVMVPAFVSRHPSPPPQATTSSTIPYYSTYEGPALAPARTIKPASETSKDFFRNMRDLQNSMSDFSTMHDALVSTISPITNFSDEILSSTIFLYLSLLTLGLFITSQLLPYRFIALFIGNALIISMHPTCQTWLITQQKRAISQSKSSKPINIAGIRLPGIPQHLHPLITSLSTITLSSTPETREVEIFELQHRPLSSFSSTSIAEWQPYLFTPNPYDPLSPARISGDRPRGARFFEDVQPPDGWEFHSKKWELDLEAGEWVSERLVVGVEYDILQTDKDGDDKDYDTQDGRRQSISGEFGGWVWDLPPAPGQGGRDEEVWLAYGDYNFAEREKEKGKGHRRDKGSRSEKEREKDWEEGVRYGNSGRTGEWRRRRWVRVVRRRWAGEHLP